jgi:MYXO-CTERM domain-containing protein
MKSAAITALCACSFALHVARGAHAQAVVRGDEPVLGQDATPTPRARSYRDGGAWVDVARDTTQSDSPSRLRRVICTRDGHSFPAAVGAEAIVRATPGSEASSLARRYRLTHVAAISARLGIYSVRGRAGEDGVDVAARLADAPGLASAVPDLHVARKPASIDVPPDDPHYSAQWYLERLQIERAWQHTTGDRSVSIVVIDGGCDMQHPDLKEVFVGGRDLVDGDDDPSPTPNTKGNAHGTACSGIIAAAGDNGVGIAGVCPECTLHCLRLYGQGDDKLVPFSSDIAAFDYAFDNGAAVVSNSWGFADPTPVPEPLAFAIQDLIDKGRGGRGALVVFAAGNENREIGDDELVAVDGVLNVGATNNFDEAAPFSNHGPSLDLTAPNATFSTDISGPDGDDPGDYTDLFGGTSSACPVVAGVAALVVAANPELTAREAADLLITTARRAPYATDDDDGHDPVYGYGIVDPEAAVRSALGLSPYAPGEDAGSPRTHADAGARHDAGARNDDQPAEHHASSGCSCSAAGDAQATVHGLMAAVVLAALLRARRRSRSF